MARSRPVLVSAAAGIHDWPELASGLFRLEAEETLSTAIGRLRGYSSDTVASAGAASRQAAETFHHGTLQQWLEVLQRYAREPRD
jgi:hypothetical protein